MAFDFEKALINTPLCYEPCDAVKFCYQAAYGPQHLLSEEGGAREYFDEEYRCVTACDGLLTEQLSEDYFRVNLAVWKHKCLPSEWLFNMFYLSAKQTAKGDVKPLLDIAKKLASGGQLPFDEKAFCEYLKSYDGKPVNHSEICRKKASYRVVHKRYARFIPLLEAFSKCRIMAIDGRAASGKSTAADDMADITGAGVIHMDDFFLPPELRTKERLAKPGGNIDYERFAKEVLPQLKNGNGFYYNKFDCATMSMGEKICVKEAERYIVEGSYSHHPYFKYYADVKVFCDISPVRQLHRIEKRNGRQMLEAFAQKWIPMEEAYFKAFEIKEKADIVTCL